MLIFIEIIIYKQGFTTKPTVVCDCAPGYFACSDCDSCVNSTLVCDGTPQCTDGSDEVDCPCVHDGAVYQVCIMF